jgi:surface protein
MAIITATAKFYNAFKCRVVDKSFTASLSASFSIGHTDPEDPEAILPNVSSVRVLRSNNNFYRTTSGLTAQGGFAISGALLKGDNGVRSTSTLRQRFPTFVEIDWYKLDVPEGKNVTIQMEEGFVIEDRNKFPFALGSPLAFNPNLLTFRTPKRLFGNLQSQFTFPIGNFRTRLFDIEKLAMFSPNIVVSANRVGFIELESFTDLSALYGRIRVFASQMSARFGPIGPGDQPYLEGNGFPFGTGLGFWPQGFPGILRIREDTANIVFDNAASLNAEVFNLPFIWPLTNYDVISTSIIDAEVLLGVVNLDLPVQASLSMQSTVDYDSFLAGIQSQSTVVCRPDLNAKAALVSSSSMSVEVQSSSSVLLEVEIPSGFNSQRTFGLNFTGNVLVNISWGDGTVTNNVSTTGNRFKTYATAGTYIISIDRISDTGIPLEQWRVTANGTYTVGGTSLFVSSPEKVKRCLSFGKLNTINLGNTFNGCTNLTSVPTFLPDSVRSLNDTFNGCTSLNDSNLISWNTSQITNMAGVFQSATSFNQPIGSWNTSNVTVMIRMFNMATAFNQPIGSWNTSNVTSMRSMFLNTSAFNQNINTWNVSKVTDFASMFDTATAFNQPLNNWVLRTDGTRIDMALMFAFSSFNQPIGNWNTQFVFPVTPGSTTTGMVRMFRNNTAFNQNLSGWCVPSIPSLPLEFDTGATAWTLPNSRPIWGTCP